jgi:hypothetical protein
MVFPVVGGNESKGYDITNSLRFNNDDSPKLTFTPSSAGNRRTFTLSVWFKLSVYSTGERVLLAADDGTGGNNNFDYIAINGNDKLFVYGYEGSENQQLISTQLFRDPSAWYHLVVAFDTTDGTASNRIKAYVNGNQITAFDTANYPSQNFQTRINNNNAQRISSYPDQDTSYFDGYMCEYHLVDGSQLAPTSFGEFDNNGVWKPIKYDGSYGTNGFFLEFKQTGTSANSSGEVTDTSGNDNHFTPTNLAATDITEDTCTNNFATMLPILYNSDVVTFSEGNVKLVGSSSADGGGSWASIVPTSGKWYAEVKLPDAATTQVGFATIDTWSDARNMLGNGTFLYAQDNNTAIKLRQGGSTANASVSGGSNSYSTYSDDTIINLALDMDNGKAYFGINGTYMNSSNPANGTNSFSLHTDYTSGVTFACGLDAATAEWNFGNPSFSISSGNNDGKYGNFEYAPPSGYYALCTKRLAEFG